MSPIEKLIDDMTKKVSTQGAVELFGKTYKPGPAREAALESPEMKTAALTYLKHELKKCRFGGFNDASIFFRVSADALKSKEMVEAGTEGVLGQLRFGNITDARNLMKTFGLTDEFFSMPEAAEAAKAGLAYLGSRKTTPEVLVATYRERLAAQGIAHLLD